MKTRIGLYFGSFNPVHTAHIQMAQTFLDAAQLDEIWWVLSPQNPHKSPLILAPFHHRCNMLKLALKELPFSVCEIENQLPFPSYTIHTLHTLNMQFPDVAFILLMGEDSWNALPTWKQGDEIERDFEIFVYKRFENTSLRMGRYHLLNAPLLDMSSTKIREGIQQRDLQIAGLLPVVKQYIEENKLYR